MVGETSKSWAIGICLGTANIQTAVFRDGRVDLIPDQNGDPCMPAYVAFDGHNRLVGSFAKNRVASNPRLTLHNLKRFIGRRFNDPELQNYLGYATFLTSASEDGALAIEVEYGGEKESLKVVEVLAILLLQAKLNAEAYLGVPVSNSVISVPASFNREQRHAVLDAADMAGLSATELLASPAAILMARAFKAYTSSSSPKSDPPRNVIVIDIGAGFCNVGLGTIEFGVAEVVATGSDPYLGGNDFDMRLLSHLSEQARRQQMDIWSTQKSIQRVRKACEAAKIALSSAQKHHVFLESLVDGKTFEYTVTRNDFEEMCKDLFLGTLDLIKHVLSSARDDRPQIDEVVLAGGCSRIPRLRRLWAEFLGTETFRRCISPEDIEVYGTAMLASRFSGYSDPGLDQILLLETVSLSLGVETSGGMMTKVIRRNNTVPTLGVETFCWDPRNNSLTLAILCPAKAPPQAIRPDRAFVSVYEGEFQRAKDNQLLGRIDITSLLPSVVEGYYPLQIKFEMNAKHKLTVRVWHHKPNLSVTAYLNSNGRVSENELIATKKRLREYKEGDRREATRIVERCRLEERLRAFRDTLMNVSNPSSTSLLEPVNLMILWIDENQSATIDEYQQCQRDVDDLEKTAAASAELELSKAANISDRFARVSLVDEPISHGGQDEVPTSRPTEQEGSVSREDGGRIIRAPKPEDSSTAKAASSTKLRSQLLFAAPISVDPGLESMFSMSAQAATKRTYTDVDFERVSHYLDGTKQRTWAVVPRIYTVLRLISQLDKIEVFLQQGLSDMWFPFTSSTLPAVLAPEVQAQFLEIQSVVFSKSKSFHLETSERKHAYFSATEPLPLRSVAKLGVGTHGSVDKVVSTLTHKIYARKVFRKSRGFKKEDVQTFRTELDILKQVHYKHCVSLVSRTNVNIIHE